jgi:hypothetical protein
MGSVGQSTYECFLVSRPSRSVKQTPMVMLSVISGHVES